jgi:hypothetical protein
MPTQIQLLAIETFKNPKIDPPRVSWSAIAVINADNANSGRLALPPILKNNIQITGTAPPQPRRLCVY